MATLNKMLKQQDEICAVVFRIMSCQKPFESEKHVSHASMQVIHLIIFQDFDSSFQYWYETVFAHKTLSKLWLIIWGLWGLHFNLEKKQKRLGSRIYPSHWDTDSHSTSLITGRLCLLKYGQWFTVEFLLSKLQTLRIRTRAPWVILVPCEWGNV